MPALPPGQAAASQESDSSVLLKMGGKVTCQAEL